MSHNAINALHALGENSVELYDIKGKLEEIEKQVKVMAALRVERAKTGERGGGG